MSSGATHSTPLSVNVGRFVPKKIVIGNASGQDSLDTLQRGAALPAAVPPVLASSTSVQKDIKRPPIQIESQEQQENLHTHSRRPSALGARVSSATALTSKNVSQLLSKFAWAARGPPQQNSASTTPRSQSLAPPTPVSATNLASFRATPSALLQGVFIKDGVRILRSAAKQGKPNLYFPRLSLPESYAI